MLLWWKHTVNLLCITYSLRRREIGIKSPHFNGDDGYILLKLQNVSCCFRFNQRVCACVMRKAYRLVIILYELAMGKTALHLTLHRCCWLVVTKDQADFAITII